MQIKKMNWNLCLSLHVKKNYLKYVICKRTDLCIDLYMKPTTKDRCGNMPAIPALWMSRLENHKLELSLGYITASKTEKQQQTLNSKSAKFLGENLCNLGLGKGF